MKRVLIPLILSLCYIADSLFVQFFSLESFGGTYILVPHFLLVVLVLMGIFYRPKTSIMYAFIFGMLYDAFYTGVLGIYLFFFPLAVYITTKMMKVLQSNLVISGIVVLFNITIVEFLVYGVNLLINHDLMNLADFLNLRLWPTLVLNLAFFIVIGLPMRNFLTRRVREEMID
ncbi:rod shape-determining protein MreD [Heyndrickxia ginsengihumi]|uniref:Rod shape-determining protein MreD n=1 Tax=Heyndrickxia ginsengihumi TaxID=363870 RepID=A0A0A6VHS0_9BACI|nr:rod shape-determining protein MreD [Heyndrickxia ginsengihumi]KHD86968.1 rod shape-determining protein MreD [Heyndrickxia ginsengihumi]MBE6184146.1 rod shape-determining protein MreD [Bacillus sp. (in: firmicutes)]MCM3021882.1 rod shape-determining protein MreD [Heyndrickxia ginsengihumi]NEY20432.1 rod shape-determining protein MreD [Heyndrickxia ginsengihumi]